MTTQTTATPTVEERLAALEATLTAFIAEQREWRNEVNERFVRLESGIDRLGERITQTNERIDRLNERVDRINDNLGGRIDRMGVHVNRILYVALGGMLSVIVAGVIAIVFGA